MKTIKNILSNLTIQRLIGICRTFGFKGYANKLKDDIINLIVENVKNPQVKSLIAGKIPANGTSALIFKILLDNNNEYYYQSLKSAVLEKRTLSTFRANFNKLIENNIIFEMEDSDDSKILLPKEFTDFAITIINTKMDLSMSEEMQEEIEEVAIAQEKKEITTVDDLLYSKKYVQIDDLINALEAYEIETTGNKSQLIDKLLYGSTQPTNDVMAAVFGRSELSEICQDFGLPSSGNKDVLINRILEKLPLKVQGKGSKKSNSNLAKEFAKSSPVSKLKKKTQEEIEASQKTSAVASGMVSDEQVRQENKPLVPKEKKGIDFDDLVTFLRSLRPLRIEKEGDLQIYLKGILEGKYGVGNVRDEKAVKAGSQRYDLLLFNNVLIETKRTSAKKEIDAGIGQTIGYLDGNTNILVAIIAVFDTSDNKKLINQFADSCYNGKIRFVFW